MRSEADLPVNVSLQRASKSGLHQKMIDEDSDECGCVRTDDGECGCLRDKSRAQPRGAVISHQ
jgi:hypothetical protein